MLRLKTFQPTLVSPLSDTLNNLTVDGVPAEGKYKKKVHYRERTARIMSSEQLLSSLIKKKSLASTWQAAHCRETLTMAQILETDVEKSVDDILQSKLPLIATGDLLLGVARISLSKSESLLADCAEFCVKTETAVTPRKVELPEERCETAVTALPEVSHDFDTVMPEPDLNHSREEEITREDCDSLSLVTHDKGFGNMSCDDKSELLRHGSDIELSTSDQVLTELCVLLSFNYLILVTT
ncbi:PREDICTED: double-strand-break repair protein rad21 homolog isoform X2 [Vollenhovia emeryi]|uniref:double-strand-break repair protein rad21 homolog isoform X2 n=1 Tax=Vollenhovia emeryi TaxID=411798 RepID=UPI0005F370F0|nr:PREDICTED: double-strand-break repair protein rad21 homolog isoform X2 [Vollenhovia emeryi]